MPSKAKPVKAKPVGFFRRAGRLIGAHLLAQLRDPHAWNAAALIAISAIAAVPVEVLDAHAWLRAVVPMMAAAGVTIKALTPKN